MDINLIDCYFFFLLNDNKSRLNRKNGIYAYMHGDLDDISVSVVYKNRMQILHRKTGKQLKLNDN